MLFRHLGDRVDYIKPEAGLFYWFDVQGIDDTKELIYTKAREEKVLLLPGNWTTKIQKCCMLTVFCTLAACLCRV